MNSKDRKKFKDAHRLFATNEKCAKVNLNKLVELKNPMARINAKHEGLAGTVEQASRLKSTLFLSKNAKVMLQETFALNRYSPMVLLVLLKQPHANQEMVLQILPK